MTESQRKILVIDDDADVRKFLAASTRHLGFDVATAGDRAGVEHKLDTFEPDIVLLDLQMPDVDGIQMLKVLRNHKCTADVILVSGVDQRTLETARDIGRILGLSMLGELQKPILISQLRKALEVPPDRDPTINAAAIEKAISKGQIRPAYQPQAVKDRSGNWSIGAVEVLARWHRSTDEVIMPGQFISLAERSGLLPSLTDSILTRTLAQLSDWDTQGIHLNASVNLAPSLLTDPTFPDRLTSKTRAASIDNARLTLELTESSMMQNAGLAMEILGRLRVKGFDIAIDDFGTGYSSLEVLYRMPFNELKIDRFLVSDIGNREAAATIVDAIVTLGHKLGLRICAEGIEHRETLDFLLETGCDKLQGYCLSRPLNEDAVPGLVRRFAKSGFSEHATKSLPLATSRQNAGAQRPLPILCLKGTGVTAS